MVICLEQGASHLHMVQLMLLPPGISCFIKTYTDLTFSCQHTQAVLEKRQLHCISY